MITYQDFQKVEMHAGTIIEAAAFPQARKPAYLLQIDFGPELGRKQSSAQITKRYTLEELVGRQIIAVTNFPPRQIAHKMSEVLVLGNMLPDGDVVLLAPEQPVPDGSKIA